MDMAQFTWRKILAHQLRNLVSYFQFIYYSGYNRNIVYDVACKRFIFSLIKDYLDHEHEEKRRNRPDSWRVWLASAGSITVIATCEVFAVLVVPIMQRVFYQHINQFLIALAIGSLLGNNIKQELVWLVDFDEIFYVSKLIIYTLL